MDRRLSMCIALSTITTPYAHACIRSFGGTVFRYNAVITPVINYILEVFPEGSRDTKPMELAYEDLEKLSGEEVMRICEWLTDKVPFKMAIPYQYVALILQCLLMLLLMLVYPVCSDFLTSWLSCISGCD